MAVTIQRLVCNVTVVTSTGAPGSIDRGTREATAAEPGDPTTDVAAQAGCADGDAGAQEASTAIDPRAVADRVYRLMRDELAADRERE